MSSTGSGYDLSSGTFSPDGRIFQVEYAKKAVDKSGTAIGIRCSDGVIMGVEKLLLSKMLVAGTNRRVYNIDSHIGMSLAGLSADGRQLANRAREEAHQYKSNYGVSIPPKILTQRMGQYVHYFTLYGSIRPFGASTIFIGYDQDLEEPYLGLVEPSGVSFAYRGCAIGKGQQSASTEIEKYRMFDMTCREGIKYLAKIMHILHDEVKDKPFELEMSWVCKESNWKHEFVPNTLRDEAQTWAKNAIEEDEMADDDDDE